MANAPPPKSAINGRFAKICDKWRFAPFYIAIFESNICLNFMEGREFILSGIRAAIETINSLNMLVAELPEADIATFRQHTLSLYNTIKGIGERTIRNSTPEDDADGSITRIGQLLIELEDVRLLIND
jgi:hypothetical protein